MTKILALDVSSVSSGYAVIENGDLVKDAYGLIQPDKKLPYGARLVYFQNEIRRIIKLYNPEIIAIEDIFKGRNMLTFKSLSMFRGVAFKTIFEEINKDPVNIMAVEARSTLGLDPSKDKAFKQAIKKFKLKGFKFEKDNDVVDAIILGVAIHTLLKQGINEQSLHSSRRKKRRGSKGNKKRLPKIGPRISS